MRSYSLSDITGLASDGAAFVLEAGDHRGDLCITKRCKFIGDLHKETKIRGHIVLLAPCLFRNITVIGSIRVAHEGPDGTVLQRCRLRAPILSGAPTLTDVLRLENSTVDADSCVIDGFRWGDGQKGRARCGIRLEECSICSLRRCTLSRASCAVSISSTARCSVFVAHDCFFYGNCFSLSARAGQVLISECQSQSLVKDWDYKDADVDVIASLSSQPGNRSCLSP